MKGILRLIKNVVVIAIISIVVFITTVFALYYKLSDPKRNQELIGVIKKPTISIGSIGMGIMAENFVKKHDVVEKGQILAKLENPDESNKDLLELKASTEGKIETVFIDEGGFVRAGNLIYEITKENEAEVEVNASVYNQKNISTISEYVLVSDNGSIIPIEYTSMRINTPNQQSATFLFSIKNESDILKLSHGQSVSVVPLKVAIYRKLLADFSQKVVDQPKNIVFALSRSLVNQ